MYKELIILKIFFLQYLRITIFMNKFYKFIFNKVPENDCNFGHLVCNFGLFACNFGELIFRNRKSLSSFQELILPSLFLFMRTNSRMSQGVRKLSVSFIKLGWLRHFKYERNRAFPSLSGTLLRLFSLHIFGRNYAPWFV